MELNDLSPKAALRRKIRDDAVRKVRKDLILAGKCEEDLSSEDLEYLLADAEKEVISSYKQTALVGALAIMGINLF